MLFNVSVQDRLADVGLLTGDMAHTLGTVGPAARASGLGLDVRTESPRLQYGGFQPATLRHPVGDVASRVNMRALEVDATIDLLDHLLAGPLALASASVPPSLDRSAWAGSRAPAARRWPWSRPTCTRVARLHLKTASLTNWPSLARAVSGNLLPTSR